MKICPVCGARSFSDMDICYCCLYDYRLDGVLKGSEERISNSKDLQLCPDEQVPFDYREEAGVDIQRSYVTDVHIQVSPNKETRVSFTLPVSFAQ